MILQIPPAENLPQELLPLNCWHAWRNNFDKKLPIDATGKAADHVEARCSLLQAEHIARNYSGGIGLSIDNQKDGTDFVFLDLDGCLNGGEVKPWAEPILNQFSGTYSQYSVSGTGIHIICRGKYPSALKKVDFEGTHHNIQIFDTKRFCAMTGEPEPQPITNKQEALNWLAEYLKGRMPGDWPSIKKRAEAYLAKVPLTTKGNFQGTRTLETAMKVMTAFNLNHDEAYEVLSDWNKNNEPPYPDDRLRRKISEADKHATADRGKLLRSNAADHNPQSNQGKNQGQAKIQKPDMPVWREGEPLPEIDLGILGHSTVEPFPLGEMPQPFGDYAREAAESIRTHSDLTAVAMLATLGGAIGRAVNVQIRPGWVAWPSCWYCLVSPVGFGKSPAIAFAERKLKEIDARLFAQSAEALALWEAECDACKKGEAKPPKPLMRRLRVRSATLASLIDIHRQNELGIFYSPDELNSWLLGMSEFNKSGGSDRPSWLSARTGGDMSQDRIQGGPRYLQRSAITILGGIPPAMLGDVVKGPGDGLLERLMFAYPDHHHRPDPPALDASQQELLPAWDMLVNQIYNIRIDENGEYLKQPIIMKLADDSEAAGAFHAIECRMNAKLNDDSESALAGFYSKIPYDIAHWAMTLALLEAANTSPHSPGVVKTMPIIRAKHVNAAGAIADYFLACASKVVEHCGGMRPIDRRIIRKIIKTRSAEIDSVWLNNSFSGRNRPRPETLKSIIDRLAEARIILRETEAGRFKVNPNVFNVNM